VEITLFQKKIYRAVLERNRDVLCRGSSTASVPSLINLQMELRKCCNHPFLIKGVEEAETAELTRAGARARRLSGAFASDPLVSKPSRIHSIRSHLIDRPAPIQSLRSPPPRVS
jgi:chromodomain-helicase-DNA-binding protein 7